MCGVGAERQMRTDNGGHLMGGRWVFDLSASWPVNTQHSPSKGGNNTRADSNIPGASVTAPHNKQEALELNTLVFRFSNLNLSNTDGWRWRKQSSTSRCGSKASTSRSHFQRSLASDFVLLLLSHLSRLVCFQLGGSSGWWPEKTIDDRESHSQEGNSLAERKPRANIKRCEWRSTRTKVVFLTSLCRVSFDVCAQYGQDVVCAARRMHCGQYAVHALLYICGRPF